MHVVVTGAGNVGRHLAEDLSERGHQVMLIEQDTAAALEIEELENFIGRLAGEKMKGAVQ